MLSSFVPIGIDCSKEIMHNLFHIVVQSYCSRNRGSTISYSILSLPRIQSPDWIGCVLYMYVYSTRLHVRMNDTVLISETVAGWSQPLLTIRLSVWSWFKSVHYFLWHSRNLVEFARAQETTTNFGNCLSNAGALCLRIGASTWTISKAACYLKWSAACEEREWSSQSNRNR